MSAVHCSPVLITLRKSSASFTLACLALPGTWGLTDLSLDAAGQTPDTQTLSWIPHAWAQFPVRLPWICFLIAVSLFLDGLSGSSSGCHLCVCVCEWTGVPAPPSLTSHFAYSILVLMSTISPLRALPASSWQEPEDGSRSSWRWPLWASAFPFHLPRTSARLYPPRPSSPGLQSGSSPSKAIIW